MTDPEKEPSKSEKRSLAGEKKRWEEKILPEVPAPKG